jgi:hypothetical protein
MKTNGDMRKCAGADISMVTTVTTRKARRRTRDEIHMGIFNSGSPS